jgi:hypothetical protein
VIGPKSSDRAEIVRETVKANTHTVRRMPQPEKTLGNKTVVRRMPQRTRKNVRKQNCNRDNVSFASAVMKKSGAE